jgi:hypothetical protein
MSNGNDGSFATVFGWIGGIAGAVGGYEVGGGPGMLGTAAILALTAWYRRPRS